MATESDIPVPVCEARGDQVGTVVDNIIKISVSQLSLEKQTQDEKHSELPTVAGENFLKSPSGVEVHCEVTPEIRKDVEEPDQTVKEGMDTLLLSTKDTSSDHNGVPEGSVEENFNTSADKASNERINTTPGEPVTKEVDEEFKEAELFEKEQSTTRTLVNEDKQIENHAESLHVDPENSGVHDLSQENSIDSLPEEQSRDVTPHGNATKEEEAAIDADNENKESLESFPPIVSSSHEEGSTDAVLEEGTSDHTDGKTIVEVDKHQEGLEQSSSSGEAHCDVTYVSPDVSKSTEITDQTMKDGSDTLLLSPKLSDQPVESAANEETSAEEVHQHAAEVNSTDKPAEPEQQNKDSSVLTSEIDGHDKDDTRVLSQLSNDTSSDHRSIDDSSTENVAVSEEKLPEINIPSEQFSSNAPCISKGEELNILVETADNKSVDEEAAEEDMSCLKSGVSTGESDQNEMTSEQDGLQNNHHVDGKIIDEVKEQHEVLEQNLSSGEARPEVNNFSPDVSTNTEESDSKDKDVVPEQCINDSPDVASEIDGRGVDEATVMTQLSKDTSSDNHITNDPTTEKASHESIITPGEAITKEVHGELEEAELSENERSTSCTLLNEDKHVENHAKPLHVGTGSIDSTPEEQSRDVTLHGNATEEEEAAIDADNEHKESLESFPPIVSSSQEEESVNAVLQEGTSDHTDGKTIVEVNKHQEGLEQSSSSDEAHCEVTYVSSDFSKSTESTDQTMKDGTDTLLLSPKLSDQPVESAASEETSAEEIQHAEEVNSTDKDVELEQHSKDSSVLTSEIDGHDKDDTRVVTQLSNDTSSNHMDEIDKVNEHQDVLETLPSGEAHSEVNNFSPVSGSLEEENVNAVLQEVTGDHTNRIIDEVDKKEEATENPSTTIATEDAEGDSLSQLDHSENKREDDSLKECEEVPLPLPLAREVGDVPTYLHEAQIEDGAPEKAEDTKEEHANSEHTEASDLVNKRSEGGTVDVTEEKEETLENIPAIVLNEKMEDNSYIEVDKKMENIEHLNKENESGEIEETAVDAAKTNEKTQEQNVSNEDNDKDLSVEVDATEMEHDTNLEEEHERPSLSEASQVENSIHSSQVASEATEVEAPCQDTERSFNVEQIQDSEDISGNEVEEKISNATGEEPQEAQDLAKSVTHEEDSPNERNIEAALENEDSSTELPQVADKDTEEPCLGEVRETSSQEEQIISASPGVLISDNEENKPIEQTVLQKEIPKNEETSLTAEEHPCAEDLNISKDIIGHSLEAGNDNQQESSITEVFQEHTVTSNEHVSESTSMESEVSGKNNDQAVGEASSCGDKTDSEKPGVIDDGSSAITTSETLEERDPSVCPETEVQVPHEEKEAEVINQETANDENIREALPNAASEDVSESKEVNGEEIDSNNYKELTSSPISVPPEEVFTPLTDAPKDDIIEKTLVMEVPQVENSIDSSQVASEATVVVAPCQDTEKITDATGEETQEAQDLAKNVTRDDDSPNEGNTEAVLENEDLSAELPQVADKDTEEPCLSEVRETISQEEQILSTSPEVLTNDSEENKAIEPTVLQKEIPKDEETSLTAEEHPCAEDSNVSKDIIEHSAEASNDNQQESSITEVFEEHTVTSNEHVSESTSMESEVSGGDKTDSEKTGVIDDGSSAVTTSEILEETDPSVCTETEVQVPHGEKEAEVINPEAENDENINEAIPNDASEDVSESKEVDVQEETDSNNYKELTSNPISVPPEEVSTSNVALEEHSTSNSSQEPGTETREGAETKEGQIQEPVSQISELINDSPVERIERVQRDTIPSRANDSAIQETGLTTEEHPSAEDLNVSKDIIGNNLEASNDNQQESSITEVFEEHAVTSNEHVSESTSMESEVSGGDKTDSEKTGVIDDGSSAVTTSEILEETDPSVCTETEVQVPHEEKEAEVINQEAEIDEHVKEALPNDASEDVSESKEVDVQEKTDSNTYKELTSCPISVPSEEVPTSNVALEEHSTSDSAHEPGTETRAGAEAEEDQNQEPAPQVSELIQDSPVEITEKDKHPSPASANDSTIAEEVEENITETTECKESDAGNGAQNEAYEEKTPATMVIDEETSSATYLETKNGEEAPEIQETIQTPSSAEETSNSAGSLAEQNSDSNEAATTPTENKSGDDSINQDLEAIAQGCEPISTTEEERLEADAEIKLDEAENEEIQGETTRENEIVKGDSLSTKEKQSPEETGLTTEEHPCAGDLNVSKDIIGLEANNDNQQESSLTEVFEEHTVSSNEHVSESTSMESEVSGGDKTGSEETGVIDDGSSAVTTSETLEETDPSACPETEVQVPHEEKEAEVINQEAEIDENIKEALPNDASEDVSESKELDAGEETDSNTYRELTSIPIPVPSEEVLTSNVVLEEHSTSNSSQEPRTEIREGAEAGEDQNQEPAPQVSELIHDSPVERIERDTHPSPARAHDSTITEEVEENIKETTTDCKESDAGNGAQNESYEEKTPATMVIDEETSSVTHLQTENGEEAPEIEQTIQTPSSADETSNSAGSLAEENSDSNEAATTPTENKSGDDSINQDLEANAQGCQPISTTEEEKLEADAEIQGEITRENEIVKGDSLSTKEEQSPGVANVYAGIDEAVENVLHQEDQDRVTSNELNIARKEEEGDKIAAIPDKESEERDKKDEISSSDEVQARDEEVLILSEEKREEEAKETHDEAYVEAEKSDFACQTSEISERAISDDSQQDIPKDNENSSTLKKFSEDDSNKSRECEVPSAAVIEETMEETIRTDEVQEEKVGIALEDVVPESTGFKSNEVEEVNDISETAETPVMSTSKIVPELTEGTPLVAEYQETELHSLPEELSTNDFEVKEAGLDDAVNIQSIKDISEECKESFEVSSKEKPVEGDPKEKIETGEVQETEPIQNALASETVKQETEEQQLARGTADVHEEEKNTYDIIPKQLESSYGAESEKVSEPIIHRTSIEDTTQQSSNETSEKALPVNIGGLHSDDASEQEEKHAVLEADDTKNSILENLDDKLSSEISRGEHEAVQPPKLERETEECRNEDGTNHEVKETSPMADHSPAEKELTSHTEDMQAENPDEDEHEKSKTDEERENEEDSSHEHEKSDLSSEAPVMVDMGDADVKVTPKKSHNILSGVGSKVKHSIAKVKKAITGKSSHPKTPSPSKVVN